jgi:hypothetical protein
MDGILGMAKGAEPETVTMEEEHMLTGEAWTTVGWGRGLLQLYRGTGAGIHAGCVGVSQMLAHSKFLPLLPVGRFLMAALC